MSAAGDLYTPSSEANIQADLRSLSLSPFVHNGPYSDLNVSGQISTEFSGRKPDDINGHLNVKDLILNFPNKRLLLNNLDVIALNDDSHKSLSVQSDPLNLDLNGRFGYSEMIKMLHQALYATLPAVIKAPRNAGEIMDMDATLSARLMPDTTLTSFFRLPVAFIDTIGIKGKFSNRKSTLSVYAPFLAKKNKIIENTRLRVAVEPGNVSINGSTLMPSKKGPLNLRFSADARYNTLGSAVKWKIDNKNARYDGSIDVGARFITDSLDGSLSTIVNIHPTDLVINDSEWNISPADIRIKGKDISVDHFRISRPDEFLSIDGRASADSLSSLRVDLHKIDLDYIFSTLNISPNVNFGGIATGQVIGTQLLSKEPVLRIPLLDVKDFSYNNCVMGDAKIVSGWDNERKVILLDADVRNHDGGRALVKGYINPLNEALDLTFDAERAPVGFMQNFMAAFASDVSGHASGKFHLYGTFSDIDLEGKVKAENLGLKLAFTNVTYFASDSVVITPGEILLDSILLHDEYNRTALLSGKLTHRFFHDPVFN
ncbi:MAG: hypothetical protein K2K55_07255, partial [Duncaniella sp.]|nr:hypothetical protein [Duncaniella sp.]